MPGFRTPLHLPEDMGAWVAELIAKGYRFPERPRRRLPPEGVSRNPPTAASASSRPSFPPEDSETAYLTDEFLKWLLVREQKPWFAHVVFFRPHPPLIAPAPYNAAVDPGGRGIPAARADARDGGPAASVAGL